MEVCIKAKKRERFIRNENLRKLVFGRFASTMSQALFWTQDIMVSKPDVYYHTAYALVLTKQSVIVILSDMC